MARKKFDAEVTVGITGNTSEIEKGLKKTEKTVKKTSANIKKSLVDAFSGLKNIKMPSLGFGGLAAGLLAGIGINDAAKDFLSFEDALQGVFNRSIDKSTEFKDSMRKNIYALSDELNVSSENIANYLYKAQEVGIPSNMLMSTTKEAIQSAKLLKTDVLDVLSFAGQAYASFGDAIGTPTEVIQKLQVASMQVNGSFAEFSSSFEEIIPKAKLYGITFDDVIGSMVQLNKQGLKAGDSQAMLNVLFEKLGDSTSLLNEGMHNATGKSFKEFAKAGGTVYDAMKKLVSYVDTYGLSAEELFGGSEEYATVKAIIADNYSYATKVISDMSNVSNIANEQQVQGLNKSNEAVAGVSTAFSNMKLKVLDQIAPELVAFLEDLPGKIEGMTPKLVEFTKVLVDALGGDRQAKDEILSSLTDMLNYVGEMLKPIAEDIGTYLVESMGTAISKGASEWIGKGLIPSVVGLAGAQADLNLTNFENKSRSNAFSDRSILESRLYKQGFAFPENDIGALITSGGKNISKLAIDINGDAVGDRLSDKQINQVLTELRRFLSGY